MAEVLFAAAAVASVAGGVMGYNQAQDEARMHKQNAEVARQEGTIAAQIEQMRGREATGRARALASASGLTVDGSAADVIGAMASQADYSARSAIYLGRRRAEQSMAERRAAKRRGTASLISGFTQAATIITGMPAGGGGGAPATAPAGGGTAGRMGPWG